MINIIHSKKVSFSIGNVYTPSHHLLAVTQHAYLQNVVLNRVCQIKLRTLARAHTKTKSVCTCLKPASAWLRHCQEMMRRSIQECERTYVQKGRKITNKCWKTVSNWGKNRRKNVWKKITKRGHFGVSKKGNHELSHTSVWSFDTSIRWINSFFFTIQLPIQLTLNKTNISLLHDEEFDRPTTSNKWTLVVWFTKHQSPILLIIPNHCS